jgi:3-phenylpropionate/trans-cinnamate dioxygenase ferredoxin component
MTDQAKRVRVAAAGEVRPGEARVLEAEGRSVALFNVEGRYYAIDNVCPHRGGPLGEGDLEGSVVSCPWHAWRFDVASGANVNNPAVKLGCYAVSEEGGSVFVELPVTD